MNTTPQLYIGAPVWIYDSEDANGNRYGGLIEREYWKQDKVVGETSRSWIIGEWRQIKLPKKGPCNGYAFSQAEVDQLSYVRENRYRISEFVRGANYYQLKKIEEILGLTPEQVTGEKP